MRPNKVPYYVCGHYVTVLAGPELAHAYRAGFIRRWGRYATYTVAPIFRSFVDHFWSERKRYERNHNLAFAQLCKMMLSSLHGKFGQRSSAWEHRPELVSQGQWETWYSIDAATRLIRRYMSIGDDVFEFCGGGESSGSFPAISAFVTSYARQHMRAIKALAGRENVYYMATDSIAVNAAGSDNLVSLGKVDTEALGLLKCECFGKDAQFWQANHYRIGDKRVQGGRKLGSAALPDGGWVEQQFDGIMSVVEHGGNNCIRVKRVVKRATTNYTKGTVSADGTVDPYSLFGPDSEWEATQ